MNKRKSSGKKSTSTKSSPEKANDLIEKISQNLSALERKGDKALIQKIRADLSRLKLSFGTSDAATRQAESRQRTLQHFIDHFPSMLGYWNKDLRNVHSNKVYADYFGKTPEGIKGQGIKDLLGDRIFKLNLPYIRGVLRGEPQTFERRIPTPDGSVKHTLASYVPHVVDGEVNGFFVVVTDISGKKALEERTKNLETALYEQSKLSSLGQMASGIAHEINNPMAVIYSNACLLLKEIKKNGPRNAKMEEQLAEIERMSLRIEQIVDGLRAVTRGLKQKDLLPTNLNEVVERTLAICEPRLNSTGLSLKWVPPDNPVYVMCLEVQISEIILNLLNNAFDALKNVKNAQVSIFVKTTKTECRLFVANNGPPISEEVRKNLFVPFFTTKGKNGTGLGLKISRDLAIANQGDLSLSQGKETQFILTLNLASKRL